MVSQVTSSPPSHKGLWLNQRAAIYFLEPTGLKVQQVNFLRLFNRKKECYTHKYALISLYNLELIYQEYTRAGAGLQKLTCCP